MPQMSVYVTRNQGHQNMMKIELKIYKLRDALQQKKIHKKQNSKSVLRQTELYTNKSNQNIQKYI